MSRGTSWRWRIRGRHGRWKLPQASPAHRDREKVKQRLAEHGAILSWAEDDLAEQSSHFARPEKQPVLHVMTDAAGAMSRETAGVLGVTLLNSYVTVGTIASRKLSEPLAPL